MKSAGKKVVRIHSTSTPEPPELRVLIYHGGQVVRSVVLPDPRLLYIQEFNKQGEDFGLVAKVG